MNSILAANDRLSGGPRYCCGLAAMNSDAGDEVDDETQNGPRHQPLQRPERKPLRHAEHPQVQNADHADEHGHADEVQAFAQRQEPPDVSHRLVSSLRQRSS